MFIQLSQRSRAQLATAHPDLIRLFNEVSKRTGTTVIKGHRPHDEQDDCFARGVSKLRWPDSKHNSWPSEAVDAGPSPLPPAPWAREPFIAFAKIVFEVAAELAIPLRWGADWDRDGKMGEPGEWDYPHFELVSPSS